MINRKEIIRVGSPIGNLIDELNCCRCFVDFNYSVVLCLDFYRLLDFLIDRLSDDPIVAFIGHLNNLRRIRQQILLQS